MYDLDYFDPRNLDEALALLAKHAGAARLLAGGTDLLPRLRSGSSGSACVIDLRCVPLDSIQAHDGCVYIGARVTHTQAIRSALIAEHLPVLVEACRQVGGPPIRNRGTLGGNIANASPAADAVPPLLAADAEALVASASGRRTVPLVAFFVGPGRTVLAPDEILLGFRAPLPGRRSAAAFLKLGQRRGMAIAIASAAVHVTLDGLGRVAAARIALGSVAPVPWRARLAEAALEGARLSEAGVADAARLAALDARPITDPRASAGYRRQMVAVLVRRALEACAAKLAGEE